MEKNTFYITTPIYTFTILSNKSSRGWEIQMESEKLYYFTINILDQKKKTLPIPSGKCSMLIDKL